MSYVTVDRSVFNRLLYGNRRHKERLSALFLLGKICFYNGPKDPLEKIFFQKETKKDLQSTQKHDNMTIIKTQMTSRGGLFPDFICEIGKSA